MQTKKVKVDAFYVRKEEYPFALFHYTGDKFYNIRVRAHAKRLGLRLNQYGIFKGDSGNLARGVGNLKTERQICEYLGVTYRNPHDRNANARSDKK